ncbi:Cytochrome c552 [Hyphomicrobium sulfonivorans]|uniref:Cytochrome c552 n=1 Tax=Hyphomicrobium sulfonivorans TaxID=121290 RepID=A0A125NVH7_HYPSL|nr:cytochrome c [Hyphomicrobium sulfonivorans]KWT69808.1 Cytochrome c552 [Hyphomicrobium sulfonivorans]
MPLMTSSRSICLMLATASVIAAASLAPASAQMPPNVKAGRQVAEKLCVGCHIVMPNPPNSTVSAEIPAFQTIANRPGQTADTVVGAILIPHPPMPNTNLSREEVNNVAAYIMSLKNRR